MIFVVTMVVFLVVTKNIPMLAPLIFLGVLFISHSILGIYSKKEPQLAQMIMSGFKIFKSRIPEKLVV